MVYIFQGQAGATGPGSNCVYASYDISNKAIIWNIGDCYTLMLHNICAKELINCPIPPELVDGKFSIFYAQPHLDYSKQR